MEHYFSENPESDLYLDQFEKSIGKIKLNFYTGTGVFSKNGIDFGSLLLINSILDDFDKNGKIILDMGCGYGPIGIFIAAFFRDVHVDMADVNERAVELALKNIDANKIKNANALISDRFTHISRKYDSIVTNPPIRAGKRTVFSFYEGAFDNLKDGGCFYCVIQKKQGAESSQKKLTGLFGNCIVLNKKSGYRVLKSTK